MLIKNAKVFEEYGAFVEKDIYIDGKYFSTASSDSNEIDADGLYAIPGLTDLHFHACMGADFCDGTHDAFRTIAEYQLKNGVTTICPATMTFAEETLAKICKSAASYQNESGATLVGINMEGPFISPAKKGAQNSKYIQKPNIEMFRRLQNAANGLIKLVDIAPEEDGSMEFIDVLKDEVGISLAHTTADFDIADAAYKHGARQTTHLYNAMPPFSHRAPGVIGAACDNDHVRVELITDGVHIHPAAVRTTFKMFGDDRILLISDSMMATGLSDGQYTLGGQDVTVKGKLATLADGTIAGSATNLMNCLRTAVKQMHIPLASAVKCAAVNPAKAIGIFDQYGSITPGKIGNLVLLNEDLEIEKIIFNGECLNLHLGY